MDRYVCWLNRRLIGTFFFFFLPIIFRVYLFHVILAPLLKLFKDNYSKDIMRFQGTRLMQAPSFKAMFIYKPTVSRNLSFTYVFTYIISLHLPIKLSLRHSAPPDFELIFLKVDRQKYLNPDLFVYYNVAFLVAPASAKSDNQIYQRGACFARDTS